LYIGQYYTIILEERVLPKQIAQNELDVIINIVAKFPDGVPLSKIMETLNIPISRRNVQHRLVFLVKNGLLHAEGNARARGNFEKPEDSSRTAK